MHSCIQGAEAVCKVVVYGGIDRFFLFVFKLFYFGRGQCLFCFSIAKVRLLRNNMQLMYGHLMEISVTKGKQLHEQSFRL